MPSINLVSGCTQSRLQSLYIDVMIVTKNIYLHLSAGQESRLELMRRGLRLFLGTCAALLSVCVCVCVSLFVLYCRRKDIGPRLTLS